jgi:predicted porin
VVTEKETNDDWGGTGELALSYTGEFTNVELLAYSRLAPVSGSSGVSQRTAAVFTVGRRLTYDLRVNLSGGYYYNDAERGKTSTRDIDTETFRIRPWLSYQITRDLFFEASYNHTTVKNNVSDSTANRNRVFIRFRFQLPLFD